MSKDPYPKSADEMDALGELSRSTDPIARVIYHMSMRQLAMCEHLAQLSLDHRDMANEHNAMRERQQKIVDYVDKKVRNGSLSPSLRAVAFGGASFDPED